MKRLFQILFPLVGLALLGYIISVSINGNGGWDATFSPEDTQTLYYNLFRLAGLTAFTLVSFQIITGPFMRLWEKLYGPKFYIFHAYEGVAVLVFALTHWLIIHLYMSLAGLSITEFTNLYQKPYVSFGPAALVLVGITVVTAVLTVLFKWIKLEKIWWVHFANYAVFFLVFFHSLRLGKDVNPADSSLRPIWYFFFIVAVIALIYRRVLVPICKRMGREAPSAGDIEIGNKIP